MSFVLYGYWRSGTSHRTRIALNLKGVAYEQAPVDLRAGDHKAERYLALNSQGLVPALATPEGVLIQSPAIIEWLEETVPSPPLLPPSPFDRAQVRAMAAIVGCDIHPLNNLRVLQALKREFGADEAATGAWAERWLTAGFAALEPLVARHGRGFAWGDSPTLADCYLVPQIHAAESRYGMDLSPYPSLLAAGRRAEAHPAFAAAHPDRQPDADRA